MDPESEHLADDNTQQSEQECSLSDQPLNIVSQQTTEPSEQLADQPAELSGDQALEQPIENESVTEEVAHFKFKLDLTDPNNIEVTTLPSIVVNLPNQLEIDQKGDTVPNTPLVEDIIQDQEIINPDLTEEAVNEIRTTILSSRSSSKQPSQQASQQPSQQPSQQASKQPSQQPSKQSSQQASKQSSQQASIQPSQQPSKQPSQQASKQPSQQASQQASKQSSQQPSSQPSKQPSRQHSQQPSSQPSQQPSRQPSQQPSRQPSQQASQQHSHQPSRQPSQQPSRQPSQQASRQPSQQPSRQPSQQPSRLPSQQPSRQPSQQPSAVTSPNGSRRASYTLPPIQEIELQDHVSIPINDQIEETVVSERDRKQDRKNLANDILAELPISIRYNDSINIDSNEKVENYKEDWEKWISSGLDQLEILIESIACDELKYKRLSNWNNNWARGIQMCLLVMGSAIVYLQASGSSAEVVNRFTVASGAGTTISSSLLSFCGFAKKSPHYGKISSNLTRLRNWIENKLVLPPEKRFSPYDLYAIASKAYATILLEAKEGLESNK